jgi:hypothetical protein
VPPGIRSKLGVRRAGLDDGAAVHTPIAIAPELLYLTAKLAAPMPWQRKRARRDASNFPWEGFTLF